MPKFVYVIEVVEVHAVEVEAEDSMAAYRDVMSRSVEQIEAEPIHPQVARPRFIRQVNWHTKEDWDAFVARG